MNLIDVEPMRVGWGRVYQGGELAMLELKVPRPRMIVTMVGTYVGIGLQLGRFMLDNDDFAMTDTEVLAMTGACLLFLKMGFNLYIHCFEGKWRSTYMDVAVHMAALKYSYDQAFGYVKRAHPIAEMRKGTEAQLRRLEIPLKEMA